MAVEGAAAAIGAAAGIADIAGSVVGIIASIYGMVEAKRQKMRSASETMMRAYYDDLENRLGITISQIDQFLEDLGYKNTRAIDLIRGTARVGVANRIYRSVMTEYPEVKQKYNQARNQVTALVNELERKESARAAAIQSSKKGDFSLTSVAKDLGSAKNRANEIIFELGRRDSNSDQEPPKEIELDTVRGRNGNEVPANSFQGKVIASYHNMTGKDK